MYDVRHWEEIDGEPVIDLDYYLDMKKVLGVIDYLKNVGKLKVDLNLNGGKQLVLYKKSFSVQNVFK
jgi:hypothetical protein